MAEIYYFLASSSEGTGGGPAADERAFSELKRLCYAGLDGPELLGRVIARLRQTVPFEAYCASTLDPSTAACSAVEPQHHMPR